MILSVSILNCQILYWSQAKYVTILYLEIYIDAQSLKSWAFTFSGIELRTCLFYFSDYIDLGALVWDKIIYTWSGEQWVT